jgi:hypothetical protein
MLPANVTFAADVAVRPSTLNAVPLGLVIVVVVENTNEPDEASRMSTPASPPASVTVPLKL